MANLGNVCVSPFVPLPTTSRFYERPAGRGRGPPFARGRVHCPRRCGQLCRDPLRFCQGTLPLGPREADLARGHHQLAGSQLTEKETALPSGSSAARQRLVARGSKRPCGSTIGQRLDFSQGDGATLVGIDLFEVRRDPRHTGFPLGKRASDLLVARAICGGRQDQSGEQRGGEEFLVGQWPPCLAVLKSALM